MYFPRSLGQLFRLTNDYDMVVNTPYFPLLLTAYLGYEDDMEGAEGMERKVEKAGGWEPVGMNMAANMAKYIGDE